ncbi:SusC/RagA family TonB-linked outer membrane protein [Pontibacter sp. HSC-36F09]|uniref:SusC/RagA family TonB-linked outer membrane protein n=1 Tax=Pontibacter sp. HSC-36F09 TaxID=2910966 RepID=UPI0020A1E431|nr:SusC/RagA family TonB-linked outer membrane protein [Pontibacter sp. HSC-36F09]MCP2045687.1 TonB-linked SusC/RagA family outer membrane protein [Pontibacter sp. HSC-36F09]
MKKILMLCLLLVSAFIHEAMAQVRAITGTVTDATTNQPLPGVTVLVKGTSVGTASGADGTFTVNVPEGSNTLVFRFIGYQTVERPIGNQSTINVSMGTDTRQLGEVVVTALGIERNRNELAYSAQEVSGDQITRARNENVVNSLSGKVAGLDIRTNNTMGGSTNVIIRGYSSLTGNNQALFVIDGVPVSNANNNGSSQATGGGGADFGNAAADLNPDNIESVNVLKGAAATALYGSRAANGVIMITTKKGAKNSLNIAVNSGVTWSNIDKSTYVKYQKEYGGGYFQGFRAPKDLGSGVAPVVRYQDDASYGPRFDPNLQVYQWDAIDPLHPNFGKTRPWVAAANDPTAFYETGLNSNQSVVLSGGSDKTTFNLGYTRNDIKGNLPNSTIDKDMFNFNASYEATERLTVSASGNYTRTVGMGRYGTGYSGTNPNQQFRQWWQTNVDLKEQKDAYFRNRQNITWNWNSSNTGPIYSDNPYWTQYENYANDSRDNIYGYATVNYKITDWMSAMGRAAFNTTSDMQEERDAVGSAGLSSYSRYNRDFNETNFDFMLNFNKDISEELSFTGLLGTNLRRDRAESIFTATNGGLVVPKLYSISNSASPVNPPSETYWRRGVDGIFANVNFGFRDTYYMELSARQDRSTTLPKGDNAYFYPAAGVNVIFSNLMETSWLSHGKARINYAEVGNDAPPLSIYDVYFKPTGFGSTPIFSLPSTKNNPNLKPERKKSMEAGIEAEFFNNLFGFDFTVYKENQIDQIMPVSQTAASGYTNRYVNAGEVENKGFEIAAFVTPVQTGDLTWTMNFNFARNRNKVISLYEDVENLTLASFQGGVSLNAAIGQPYGVIRGNDFVYTNGQKTVGENGYYLLSERSDLIIGNPNPDWTGGFNNTLTYKGVSLGFLIDVRKGGDVFSLDQWYGEATGLYAHTAGLNDKGNPTRDPAAEGGGVKLPGVKEDGTPNDIYAENQDGDGMTPYGYAADNYNGAPRAMYVFDGSFVKLREVALSYALPESVIGNLGFVKGVDLQLIGRNLWIIHKNMEYSDPEEGLSSGNAGRGYQSGAYPAVRTYGFNVKLNF